MAGHWIQITNHDGKPGTWINMEAIAAVRQSVTGSLHIETIGEPERDPEKHPIVMRRKDIAKILAYLKASEFEDGLAEGERDGPF